MAMSITMADNADVDPYEGENIDATWTDTHRDEVGLQMEAYLCVLVKYDLVTNWAALNAIYKVIFTEFVARWIALQGILFNPAGYTDLIEAEDMVTVHIYRLQQLDELLAKIDIQDFLGA